MPDYLLEIGTEELPAGYVTEAEAHLKEIVLESLQGASLSFDRVETMSTPRRLTAIVHGLPACQATTAKKVKGPPVNRSFDQNGAPNQTASGFAAKHKLKVEALDRETIGAEEYLVANLTIAGQPTAAVLSELAPKIILKLTGERMMRWGSSDLKFSRPIRWIVSLLDDQVVAFKLDGLSASNHTKGHRILAPGDIKITSPRRYVEELKKAHVLVNPHERRKAVEDEVAKAAAELKGVARQLNGALLEEVLNITEWPKAVSGEFGKEYLDLPDQLIETIMIHHQRYFPVERLDAEPSKPKTVSAKSKALLPYFITISNNDRASARDNIKQGNERVLKARLADGRFSYFDDQKVKLSQRKAQLAQLTFQEGLGSYMDKVNRLKELSELVLQSTGLDAKTSVCLFETVDLCKLDLVTNLVRELPELQGYVGAWYAEMEGQPEDVVTAIASHYSPRSNEDRIPQDRVGQLASVLDKLDSLIGLFALNKRPSGSSDPFALRRQAQGVIDVVVDGLKDFPLNLTSLIEKGLPLFAPGASSKGARQGFDPVRAGADLHEFLMQRLRGKLLDLGGGREVVDSVLSASDPLSNVPDVLVRLESLANLLAQEGGLDLVRAAVRVGNIIRPDSEHAVDESLFCEAAERALWKEFSTFQEHWTKTFDDGRLPCQAAHYDQLLLLLKPLTPFIHQFFDEVMVNDEDERKRKNRHGLLKSIDRYFKLVADFPKLQSLLV